MVLHDIGDSRAGRAGFAPMFLNEGYSLLAPDGRARLYARVADGFDFDLVSPVRTIGATSTPILLIHGLNDTRTPPSNSERLAQANPHDPLWLVPGAEHAAASSVTLCSALTIPLQALHNWRVI
jgi:pimeloyl-ACP methyl ester carboxylesterase